MATLSFTRSLLTTKQTLSSVFVRSYSSLSLCTTPSSFSNSSLLRLLPLVAVTAHFHRLSPAANTARGFSTLRRRSSLNDPDPNWSNRPPKETILLNGCDFQHWLVVMENPEGDASRDEIIDSYVKTLALAVGSEEEARMKIYSVSTRCYYAFGALLSEELSYKLIDLPRVRWVLPDSYIDVRNHVYGGEPFINGQAAPYDPKYHDSWMRNKKQSDDKNNRNKRNDRVRNFDRSRNFERRRDNNMQNRDFQMTSRDVQNPESRMGGRPQNTMGGQPSMGGMPTNDTGGVPQNMGQMPQNNMGWTPSNDIAGGMLYNTPNNVGGLPNHSSDFQYVGGTGNRGLPYQNREMSGPRQNRGYQHSYYAPNTSGGNAYQSENMPGRGLLPPPNYQ